MHILVIGAGAIGSLVGGRLTAVDCHVTLLERADWITTVHENGLSITAANGQQKVVYPNIAKHIDEIADISKFDMVLISVKSFDTQEAIYPLKDKLQSHTHFLSLQNGIGNEEILADNFPNNPVIAGSITLPVEVPQPGSIIISKEKGGIGLAPMSNIKDQVFLNNLVSKLEESGFTVKTYNDYKSLKWSKLLMNIINNPICAILDMPPNQILDNPALFDLELESMRETVRVMRAQNIKVISLPPYPLTLLAIGLTWAPNWLLRKILQPFFSGGRGNKLPSLQIDLQRKRNQSEVTVLNNRVAIVGTKVGIPTPVNHALSGILDGIAKGNINWSDYQGKPDVLLEQIDYIYRIS